MSEPREFDAIVVGSGISGGWAAKELTERGLRTLVLEAGRPIDPARDYVEHVPPYGFPFRGWGDRTPFRREQPVQSETTACDEAARKFFVNDLENPYTQPQDAPFLWIRGRQVGGRSLTWGRQVYRWSDLDFEANARDGHGNDWPIRYADIAPWYSHVERFIGVSGAPEGLAHLPDGEFLPPMPMTDVEKAARERIGKAFGGERLVTIGRVAILTQNHNGRAACHYCGPCERGCITHSYFSSVGSTLPAARATGRLTLRPHSVVAGLTYDAKRSRVGGVRVVDAITLRETEYRARLVFLCASAIESIRLLLNSKSERFPDGMANSSGTLGRYVMDHHFGSGAVGRMRGFDDRKTFGRRPNGIYIPRFRNVRSQHSAFLRGYGMQGGAGARNDWRRGAKSPGYGADFKRSLLNELGPWTFSAHGFGETLPHVDNRVSIDANVKDKWGIPVAHIDVRWRDNEKAMEQDMVTSMAEMLEAAGCSEITLQPVDYPPGFCIHEMGGARMSRTPAEGVLNGHNQAWDLPNLFITDGACMASSACQNPSITYMALTARAAEYAVSQLKRREL
jgi:choline dehydrogenase-like flavoprotein